MASCEIAMFLLFFKSALALIHAAVHDENEVVRQTAVKVFEKHPKSNNITREHENIVLR